jgi:hypothetical protein
VEPTPTQSDDSHANGPDVHPPKDRGPQTRRQVLERHPDDRLCRRCGGPVRGRRRNGYCSDKCRLAHRREGQRRKQLELLNAIDATVQQLRNELQS